MGDDKYAVCMQGLRFTFDKANKEFKISGMYSMGK